MGERSGVVSSFTVIKGAQLEATYEVFQRWDLGANKSSNIAAVKDGRLAVTGTAKWHLYLGKTISRRFDTDGPDRILVELAQAACPMATWKPVVLWHMTRDEFLVRDFLTGWLYDQHRSGAWRLRAAHVIPYLRNLSTRPEVTVKEVWAESTTKHVASDLLRLAVDFGLMTGARVREFVSYHLPDDAFVYLLHAAHENEPNAHRLVHLPDWHMFLMEPDDVQRELFRLHQFRRLHYEVAGSLGELRLPYTSAAEFARAELMA